MIGRTLSTYRVVEKLGEGGMGEVYRARDEKLDRDVAIKVLPTGLLGDETARSRFRKEAKALSRFTHPHVATLLDFGSADGVDYLVMELVPGRRWRRRCETARLPAKDVVRLGTQLARGLKAAHEQGIVHRDLKPSNLCLTGDGLLKILDFGLAQLAPAASQTAQETPTETAAGKVVGSPPYMSPEQSLGKDVDARSDVYSAGACLYELATGPEAVRGAERGVADGRDPARGAGAGEPGERRRAGGPRLGDRQGDGQGSEPSLPGRRRAAGGPRTTAAGKRSWSLEGGAWPRESGQCFTVIDRAGGRSWGGRRRCRRPQSFSHGSPPGHHGSLAPGHVTRGLSTTADPGWASDGTSVYYSESRKGVTKYYQAPLAGGEPSEIPIPFPFGHILAYLPLQGALLDERHRTPGLRAVAKGRPCGWSCVPSGAVRRIGDLKAWQAAVSPRRAASRSRVPKRARGSASPWPRPTAPTCASC